jgi:phosphorylase kinase gamma subunit
VNLLSFQETGESFAVKIIDVSHDIVDDDGLNLRDQTLREVHILRLVQGHKYIINLEDVFESPTYIFLVFELCPNGELFDYLTTQVPPVEKKQKKNKKVFIS